MDIKELKNQTMGQLQQQLIESRERLAELVVKSKQNQLKNVREIRQIKQAIARIMTVLNQPSQ